MTTDLLEFAEQLATRKAESNGRPVGQVFTPANVARFMASRIRSIPERIRILDAGAGAGILTAAVCDRIATLKKRRTVFAELWETDRHLLPILRQTMERCGEQLRASGHAFDFQILTDDFILDGSGSDLFDSRSATVDIAILNPPYFKLNADSKQARAMSDLYAGQPNAYAAFVARCVQRLSDSGELVAITPRSFCNGLYFKGFRRYLVERVSFDRFHVFDSRTKTFESQSVLQETVITTLRREPSEQVEITSSECGAFTKIARIVAPLSAILSERDPEGTIRLPTTKRDLEAIDVFDGFADTFASLGLCISTGPVVDFRAREKLTDHANGKPVAPLLWMHNVKANGIVYPLAKRGRARFIFDDETTDALLVPDRHYVITKRFSAKEEKRRLVAGLLVKGQLGSARIGLENHLNFIYARKGELDLDLARGLAAWFNSEIVDRYFRILNGNTQVNATEIRTMPTPPLSFLRKLGREPLTDAEIEERLFVGV